MIVEIALPLEESLDYYLKKIEVVNGINFFTCETHDIYYTDNDLNGMSEEEMKNSCVRFRYVEGIINIMCFTCKKINSINYFNLL